MSPEMLEQLGEAVREAWIECKEEELAQGKNVPQDHLLPWKHLDERNKQIDRQIGLQVVERFIAISHNNLIQLVLGFQDLADRATSHEIVINDALWCKKKAELDRRVKEAGIESPFLDGDDGLGANYYDDSEQERYAGPGGNVL